MTQLFSSQLCRSVNYKWSHLPGQKCILGLSGCGTLFHLNPKSLPQEETLWTCKWLLVEVPFVVASSWRVSWGQKGEEKANYRQRSDVGQCGPNVAVCHPWKPANAFAGVDGGVCSECCALGGLLPPRPPGARTLQTVSKRVSPKTATRHGGSSKCWQVYVWRLSTVSKSAQALAPCICTAQGIEAWTTVWNTFWEGSGCCLLFQSIDYGKRRQNKEVALCRVRFLVVEDIPPWDHLLSTEIFLLGWGVGGGRGFSPHLWGSAKNQWGAREFGSHCRGLLIVGSHGQKGDSSISMALWFYPSRSTEYLQLTE